MLTELDSYCEEFVSLLLGTDERILVKATRGKALNGKIIHVQVIEFIVVERPVQFLGLNVETRWHPVSCHVEPYPFIIFISLLSKL